LSSLHTDFHSLHWHQVYKGSFFCPSLQAFVGICLLDNCQSDCGRLESQCGFLFVIFGGTGVWTQGFVPAKWAPTTWAAPPIHFALVILEMRSCGSWTMILPISASRVARIPDVSHQRATAQYSFDLHFLYG
jgi:hypothetical protein